MVFREYNSVFGEWRAATLDGATEAYQYDAASSRWLDCYREEGLVGYWSFDDMHTSADGSTTLEASGSLDDGTIEAGITTGRSSPVGEAYDFARETAAITDLSTTSPMEGGATYAAWCFVDEEISDMSGVLQGATSSPHHWEFREDELRLHIADYDHRVETYIPRNEWFHWTVAYDDVRGAGQHYINGDPIGERHIEAANSDIDVALLGQSQSGDRYFDGRLSEIRVYNRRLEDDEIVSLFEQGEGVISNSIAHWTLDDDHLEGDTVIDVTENGNDLTREGNVRSGAASAVGEGFYFPAGSGDRLSGDAENLRFNSDDEFSISAWVKPEERATDNSSTITSVGDFNGSYGLDFTYSAGEVRAGLRDQDSNSAYARFTYDYETDDWVHATTVNDPDARELRLYRNGVLAGTGSTEGIGDISSTDPLVVGGASPVGGSSAYYQGFISDIKWYDRALTQLEVDELYAKENWSYIPHLAAHWTFDDENVDGSTALDTSGYEQHGEISGGVTTGIESPVGEGFAFDGVDDGVTVTNTDPLTGISEGGTLTMWVRADWSALGSTDVRMFGSEGSTNRWRNYQSSLVNLILEMNGNNNSAAAYSSSSPPDNEWTLIHWRWEYDDTADETQFDGGNSGEFTEFNTYVGKTDDPGELNIGYWGNNNFPGDITDVRLYSRFLEEDEVARLYEMGDI